jgi:hypothetical protein
VYGRCIQQAVCCVLRAGDVFSCHLQSTADT